MDHSSNSRRFWNPNKHCYYLASISIEGLKDYNCQRRHSYIRCVFAYLIYICYYLESRCMKSHCTTFTPQPRCNSLKEAVIINVLISLWYIQTVLKLPPISILSILSSVCCIKIRVQRVNSISFYNQRSITRHLCTYYLCAVEHKCFVSMGNGHSNKWTI